MDTHTDIEPQSESRQRVVAQLGAPSLRGVARLVAIVAACAGALYLLYLTRGVLRILAISVFTATALGPVVDAVQRRCVSRAWAILLVYLACALAIVGVGAVMVPNVSPQVRQLSLQAQRGLDELRHDTRFRRYDNRYHITAKVQAQLHRLPSRLGEAAGPLRDVTVGVFGFASNLVAVLSIAFLLILHGERYTGAVISLLPPARAERWRRVAPRVYAAVSAYVIGNLEISVIAGVGAWLVMTVLGVPFAVPLAIVVGFFDLIPMIGATLGAVIVALAALLVSPLTAFLWLAYVFVYQQAENYLIQPIVYRRAVQVAPLTTIVAVLVGAALLGLLGVLLAIPAAAAAQLVVQDLRADPLASAAVTAPGSSSAA